MTQSCFFIFNEEVPDPSAWGFLPEGVYVLTVPNWDSLPVFELFNKDVKSFSESKPYILKNGTLSLYNVPPSDFILKFGQNER